MGSINIVYGLFCLFFLILLFVVLCWSFILAYFIDEPTRFEIFVVVVSTNMVFGALFLKINGIWLSEKIKMAANQDKNF